MKVIVVNGVAQSGKDSFVDYCIDELAPNGAKWSSVEFVKDVAKYCGWNGVKDEKGRKFLSDLKDLLTEWDDVPWKKVEEVFNYIKVECFQYGLKDSDFFLFIHSREPKEIERFQREYGAVTVLIDRAEVEGEQSNHSDEEVMNFNYDYIIDNNSSLDVLQERAIQLIESVRIFNKEKNKSNLTPYEAENGKEEE